MTAGSVLTGLESSDLAVTADAFRQGMRRLTGAVSLVTTSHEGKPQGLTATAVCSFSARPPRLLVCLNVSGLTFQTMLPSRRMTVNILGFQHQELAKRFANLVDLGDTDRFDGWEWFDTDGGGPLLAGAPVAFECGVDELFLTQTHAVAIGEVK